MGIYWKNIDPEMQILGATQQFIFNQNLNQFQFDNTFVPTSLIPSQNLFELRNSGLSGFRFRHETAFGDTHGTLKIQSFLNGQTTGTDLITFDQSGNINILGNFNLPSLINVSGSSQTFKFNASNAAFILDNQNSNGINEFWINRDTIPALKIGATGNSPSTDIAYINVIGGQPLYIQHDGVTQVYINGSGQVVIGTGGLSFPSAKLDVRGGVFNVFNEESVIRATSSFNSAKIEIQNTSVNGRLYEFRSDSDGTFGIVDRTTVVSRLKINTDGTFSDIYALKFTNDVVQKKLVFYDTTGNNHQYYGIGIDTGTLRYQSGVSHLFWIGTSPTTSYCGLSISSSGNIGLGNYQIATLSRLFINGGPTLDAVGEESAIRVQNSDLLSTTIKIQLHHQNAKNWELRSNSDGSFEIYDRFGLTSRFLMQGTGATTLNGSLTINNTGAVLGNLGVGTTTPTLAKLQILGGVQNLVGEDSAIRALSSLSSVKIELQNTAVGGKLYEIRSSSTGQFDITDRTGGVTRYAIDTNGNHTFSNTIYGRRASGMVYMEGNVTTTALTANVWAKIAGTTTASGFLNQFTSPVSNRLTYTGTNQVIALINVSATLNFSAGGGGTVRSISIFKNGIQITPSLMSKDIASGTNINMSTQAFVSLTTNDYIEVYCRSSANTNVTASNLILTTTAS